MTTEYFHDEIATIVDDSTKDDEYSDDNDPYLQHRYIEKDVLSFSSSHVRLNKSNSRGRHSVLSRNDNTENSTRGPTDSNRETPVPYARTGTGSTSTIARRTNLFVVSLLESRGQTNEIGMAVINVTTSEIILAQFTESQSYQRIMQKMYLYEPTQILLPLASLEPRKTILAKLLEDEIPSAEIIPIARKYFNDLAGLNYVQQYGIEDTDGTHLKVHSKNVCLAATAALIKYIEMSRKFLYVNHSLKFHYDEDEGIMMMDVGTYRNLELVQSLKDSKSSMTVYGILNFTKTMMGARLLRTSLLQPLADVASIQERLESIAEIHQSHDMYFALQGALSSFIDVDRLVTSLIQKPKKKTMSIVENHINNVVETKLLLSSIKKIHDILPESPTSLLLRKIRLTLINRDLNELSAKVDDLIDDSILNQSNKPNIKGLRCNAVKPGKNGLLDVARKAYSEIVHDIQDLAKSYADKYGLLIKLEYNNQQGFFIYINESSLENGILPECFVNVHKKGKLIQCSTLELIKMNDRLTDAMNEICLMTEKITEGLLDDIRSVISAFYKVSECIALLDMIMSFAHASMQYNYKRPIFSSSFNIEKGRHPVREKFVRDYVANDITSDIVNRFHLIMGPNMSGKSTYLKQIAILCILAHVGCFLPATSAVLPLIQRLFTRINNDDHLESNSSTFMLEMRETQYILSNLTPSSLVIIDELGRGTSTEDGVLLTTSICEELLLSRAHVFISTHFTELRQLSMYSQVVLSHLDVISTEENDKQTLQYLYRISTVPAYIPQYGMYLAELAAFPSEVLQLARNFKQKMNHCSKSKGLDSSISPQQRLSRVGIQLMMDLIQHPQLFDNENFKKIVLTLQKKYKREIELL